MKLLTKEVLESLPPLYSQEDKALDAVVPVKYFMPDGSFTWFASEYDPADRVFFGFVTSGLCPEGELGNFSLDDLESVKGALGLGVERDLHWHPKTLAEVMAEVRRGIPA